MQKGDYATAIEYLSEASKYHPSGELIEQEMVRYYLLALFLI